MNTFISYYTWQLIVSLPLILHLLSLSLSFSPSLSSSPSPSPSLPLSQDIRYQGESSSTSTTTDESLLYKTLQDICVERRTFEKEGTVLGGLSLKILLMQSATPPST